MVASRRTSRSTGRLLRGNQVGLGGFFNIAREQEAAPAHIQPEDYGVIVLLFHDREDLLFRAIKLRPQKGQPRPFGPGWRPFQPLVNRVQLDSFPDRRGHQLGVIVVISERPVK
ncbi:hypothetical protein D3C73_1333350 [compost metagenome]